MAQNSSHGCCKTASIEQLSRHIRNLSADELSSHLERCKVVMNLLISRLQNALAHGELDLSLDAHGSGGKNSEDDNINDVGDETFTSPDLGQSSSRVILRCKYGCKSFKRKQDLTRHYLCHLKRETHCPTCATIFPTASAFVYHKCFKELPQHRQKEQLESFRREIEDEYGIHSRRRRRKAVPAASLRPVDDFVTSIPSLAIVAEPAVEGGLSSNGTLPHTTGLSDLQEFNHIGAFAGVYDTSQLHLDPRYESSDPPQELLTYVENILTQPGLINGWNSSSI